MRSTVRNNARVLRVMIVRMEWFEGMLRIADPVLREKVLALHRAAYDKAVGINLDNLEYFPVGTVLLVGAYVNPYMPDEFEPVVAVALKLAGDLHMLDKLLEVHPEQLDANPALDLETYPIAVTARAAAKKGAGRGLYKSMRWAIIEAAWHLGFEAICGLNATSNTIWPFLKELGVQIVPVAEDNTDRAIFVGDQVVNWLPRDEFARVARALRVRVRQGDLIEWQWHRESDLELRLMGHPPLA